MATTPLHAATPAVGAPPMPPNSPGLTPDSDTGISEVDGLTRIDRPSFFVEFLGQRTVSLYVDGQKVAASFNLAASTVTPLQPLGDGPHSVAYTVTDSGGRESPLSPAVAIEIDTVAPEACTLDSVTDDASQRLGEVPEGGATNDDRPGFGGSGPRGLNIAVKDRGVHIGQAFVADDGRWEFTPDTPLAQGLHRITAHTVDDAGNASAASAERSFEVDYTPPSVPRITLLNDLNDDRALSQSEQAAGGALDLRVDLGADLREGDLLTVVNADGAQVEHVLAAQDIAARSVRFDDVFELPAVGGTASVYALITDAAGNNSVDVGRDTAAVLLGNTSTLAGRVWDDANADGQQQPGEAGRAGVRVLLQGAGLDGQFGTADDSSRSTTTAADGSYRFSIDRLDSYRTQLVLPGGLSLSPADRGDDATDSDVFGPQALSAPVVFTAFDQEARIDAGLISRPGVGDFVWDDVNGNGRQDAGERGVAGVKLWLLGAGSDGRFGSADDSLQSTVTAADGSYRFQVAADGAFRLRMEVPGRYKLTAADQGPDAGDSDLRLLARPQELLSNGSFESGTAGWLGNRDVLQVGATAFFGVTGATGTQVLELDANRTGGAPTGVYRDVTTVSGQSYWISLDVAQRAGTAAATNTVEVWWRGARIATIDPTSTTFKTHSFQVSGSGGKDRLEFREQAGDDDGVGGIIDNVRLSNTDPQMLPSMANLWQADAANRVVNGSFEGGSGGWLGRGDGVEVAASFWYGVRGASGNCVLELDGNRTGGAPTGVYQDIATEAGRVYELSMDLARRALTLASTNTVELWWRGERIASIDPASTTFQNHKFQVVGSGAKDRLEFREQAGDDDSLGGIIDNVQLRSLSSFAESATFHVASGAPIDHIDAGLRSVLAATGLAAGATDTLKFLAVDDGSAGAARVHQISGFDMAAASARGDVLNLRDLLQGETPASLMNYMRFEAEGSNTVLHLSAKGQFAAGFDAALDSTRVLFTHTSFGSDGSAAIIGRLLAQGKLLVDG